jgi:hypothetical protein
MSSATLAPSVASSPVNQPAGSTALHMAAAADDIGMARLLLQAQVCAVVWLTWCTQWFHVKVFLKSGYLCVGNHVHS